VYWIRSTTGASLNFASCNRVIPVAALAAVGAIGTGTVSGLRAAGAAAGAAGILVGLTGRSPVPRDRARCG